MAEGAVLPWKIQKVVQPEGGILATCRYADLSKPLPDPPKGRKWVQNESSREWSLVPCACTSTTVDGDNAASTPSEATDGVRHHQALHTDTFQGICLHYKLTPTELRRANRMLGTNLKLGPERLVIPTNATNAAPAIPGTKEEKVVALLKTLPQSVKSKLSASEVRAYLELADWDVNLAVDNVNEDFGSKLKLG